MSSLPYKSRGQAAPSFQLSASFRLTVTSSSGGESQSTCGPSRQSSHRHSFALSCIRFGCEDAFSLSSRPEALTTRLTCRLITIYDCKVVLQWKGTTLDGTEATGKLTVPEVSHEITLDGLSDYVVCVLIYLCREPWLH